MRIILAISIIVGFSTIGFSQDNTTVSANKDTLSDTLEVVKKPVILDFTAFKCKSCKIMGKRLEAIAKEFKEKAEVKFIDVNKEKKLVKQYKIYLIPTIVFLDKDGKEVFRKVGVLEEVVIRAKLKELIKAEKPQTNE